MNTFQYLFVVTIFSLYNYTNAKKTLILNIHNNYVERKQCSTFDEKNAQLFFSYNFYINIIKRLP